MAQISNVKILLKVLGVTVDYLLNFDLRVCGVLSLSQMCPGPHQNQG